ncbi:hypothetical protein O6H91_03G133100 [Diphasiastrum complanatum]|uniref:Uncharacterized protein n=2 Tax=Diphasiastrum complanatum TaxID=34168 RepID=A0ACC2CBZ5_DIPCM|nr:hypothetical protein O6H91_11G094400 [Diphasiastrum complanatum]KAJ7563988.1 hypothetical protein O6H91_03G133100 [Diphasiastrum complanatum]
MGFFEDGYLGAVVRGAGLERQQQFLNCNIFEMSCSSQPFLQAETSSSLIGLSEAVSGVMPEGSPQMSNNMFTEHIKVEETDLHGIFDSGLHQSSTFVLEVAPDSPPSIYSSSTRGVKRESIEVERETAVYGVHVRSHSISSCSLSSEMKTVIAPQRQLSGEMVPKSVSALTRSVSSSEVISSTTWPSPESQTDDIAKHFEPSPPLKESSAQSHEDSMTSKQQGSKRRKGQQKRVVCVPIAGTGRSSAEVLPSDMWAWRKYGQKPIKGSPYPRGYYRCSSSKGCSARKQVERSRNDPSMLVITYTSEHNHAWPAHRNSLAGTTRSKSLDKLRSMQDAAAAPSEPCNGSMSSIMNSCETTLKQESSLPSPLEESVINEAFTLDDQQLMLDNPSMSSSQDQHLFQDLEALPELSTIIDESFLYYRSDDDTGSMAIDPFDIFCWSSNSLLGSEIVG